MVASGSGRSQSAARNPWLSGQVGCLNQAFESRTQQQFAYGWRLVMAVIRLLPRAVMRKVGF